jgi:putative ABC transport system permease protein
MSASEFNTEAAIAAWRRPLELMRAVGPDDLRELESTLRDAIDDHRAAGASPESAFRQAVRDLDDPFAIEREYQKVHWKKSVHRHTFATEIGHTMSMLRSHVTTAFRSMRRQKGYAFINVAGLAFGLAACLLLVFFVREELSFDAFHEKADRIHRVVVQSNFGVMAYQSALMGPMLENEIPGVEATVRFRSIEEIAIGEPGEAVRSATGFLYTDASFFDVFSFPLVQGDPATALAEPWSVVLTERAAETWFPGENPMGRTLPVQGADPFTVTGVVQTPQAASSIQFDFLASMATLASHPAERGMFESGWGAMGYPTYVLVRPTASALETASRIKPLILAQTDAPFIQNSDFSLEPLREHHFSNINGGLSVTADVRFLYVFSSIAALILIIACINYINLATARATLRAREVGIRKAVGADRTALIRQFMGESLLTTLLALALALLLVAATVGPFATLVERSLAFGDLLDGPVLAALAAMVLLVGLGAGSWPAFVLARYRPSLVLKGESGGASSGVNIRRAMVVLQFAISIVLVVGTITIQRQLSFIQEKDLGFDQERVVSVRLGGEAAEQAEVLAEAYRGLPGVGGATLSGAIPSQTSARFGFKIGEVQHYAAVFPVDAVFAATMGMDIVAGRNFDPAINDASNQTREGGAIINEAMVPLLDAEDPIGAKLPVQPNGNSYRVVGVVRDFHMASLHDEITPIMLLPREDFWTRFISVRVETDDYSGVLAAMEAEWTRIDPTRPFNYRFLDEAFDQLYKGPYQLARLFNAFSLTAVLIACLGLFGLAAYTAVRRTREIGIRKALGATRRSILVLMTREFLLLVAAAFVLAVPVAWYASDRWLTTFAYRVDVGWITFLVGGVLMAVIAIGTVAWQAVRAASTNPTEALRHV